MDLLEHEETGRAPRAGGFGLIILGFLVPALIGILAVFLGGCNPAGTADPTLQESLQGHWFPCEADDKVAGGNADCRWVDDDGLSVGGKLYSSDGAFPEDPADRDSSRMKDSHFDITIKKLAAYYDDSAAYTLKGDTVAYEDRDCPACPAVSRGDIASLTGDILTLRIQADNYAPRKFRKYRGTLRIVSEAEYLALLPGAAK